MEFVWPQYYFKFSTIYFDVFAVSLNECQHPSLLIIGNENINGELRRCAPRSRQPLGPLAPVLTREVPMLALDEPVRRKRDHTSHINLFFNAACARASAFSLAFERLASSNLRHTRTASPVKCPPMNVFTLTHLGTAKSSSLIKYLPRFKNFAVRSDADGRITRVELRKGRIFKGSSDAVPSAFTQFLCFQNRSALFPYRGYGLKH